MVCGLSGEYVKAMRNEKDFIVSNTGHSWIAICSEPHRPHLVGCEQHSIGEHALSKEDKRVQGRLQAGDWESIKESEVA